MYNIRRIRSNRFKEIEFETKKEAITFIKTEGIRSKRNEVEQLFVNRLHNHKKLLATHNGNMSNTNQLSLI